jgi:hypothetical protein
MNYTYALTQGTSILRSDGANIPPDPANTDYAAYLVWVAAGNTPTSVDPAAIVAQKSAAIVAERDRRWNTGGYLAAGKWFHSDPFSRTQQLGLLAMGASMPAGVQWKTMDGSFVTMTPTLAQQILAAGGASDVAMMTACVALQAALVASTTPATFDITQGWPKIYGE